MLKQVLFICYWSVGDTLTIATVLPRLKVLQQRRDVASITLVTIERDIVGSSKADYLSALTKVSHHPYQSGKWKGRVLEKIEDFIQLPRWLAHLAKRSNVNIVLAHGAPAGALAYKVCKRKRLLFYVSSFEPHANYMVESGIWMKHGLKYKFQTRWEEKQINYATGLMPVAINYTNHLIQGGVSKEKIFTVPCTVNAATFEFNFDDRSEFRSERGWQKATVGIYVGKFGGLYYEREAYQIFKKCFELVPEFQLIILTPDNRDLIESCLLEYEIDLTKVYINSVTHQDVPAYLSAADFAFATYKPGLSKKYLSPVKIGEYWANGLPVLLTEGVGDDSDIIKEEGGGALFNLKQEGSLEQAIQQIQQIIKQPAHRQEIPKLAHKYRSPDKIKEAYDYFFGNGE